jgi:hypothetical protein
LLVGYLNPLLLYCVVIDKRGGLWWEWLYKRGGLWWEGFYKRGGLWWEWLYKRGTAVF